MHSKNIFIFLILGLLTIIKINGIKMEATYHHLEDYLDKEFNGKCKDIYKYMEGQGKLINLNDCKVNDKGEVTELRIYPYCFDNEQLKAVLSYNTIETLEFTKIIPLFDFGFIYDSDIEGLFDCTTIPTNYESLSILNNLKYLDLTGVWNLDINILSKIPKSVEILKIGRFKHPEYFKLNEKMIDILSKLTNLNSLSLLEAEINEKFDFKKFKNLKNLTSLELIYDHYNDSNIIYIQGKLFKNCISLKNLYTYGCKFDKDSIDGLGYLTKLEELVFDFSTFEDDVDLSSFKKLKNLTSLVIDCAANTKLYDISSNFFYLTKLKRFTIDYCEATIHTSLRNSLTWANLKNLEYLDIRERGLVNTEFFSDLPNVKELFLFYNFYSSISENIGNLKSVEIINIEDDRINSLPKSIGNLENLRILNIDYSGLNSLPEEFGNLKNLEELYLNTNGLTSLPESFGNLVNLRIFEVKSNHLENLPTSIGNLFKLEHLNLFRNNIVELPNSIGKLSKLQYLDLGDNNIVELPNSIGNLNITTLYLGSNGLESIPEEIGNMKNLVELDLSYNKITNIPSFLGNLEKLEELDLYNNEIDDFLPESLNNLTNLRKVNFGRNIDIKGKALSSPNLIICNYLSDTYYSSNNNTYSLCKSTDSTCVADYIPLCEEE